MPPAAGRRGIALSDGTIVSCDDGNDVGGSRSPRSQDARARGGRYRSRGDTFLDEQPPNGIRGFPLGHDPRHWDFLSCVELSAGLIEDGDISPEPGNRPSLTNWRVARTFRFFEGPVGVSVELDAVDLIDLAARESADLRLVIGGTVGHALCCVAHGPGLRRFGAAFDGLAADFDAFDGALAREFEKLPQARKGRDAVKGGGALAAVGGSLLGVVGVVVAAELGDDGGDGVDGEAGGVRVRWRFGVAPVAAAAGIEEAQALVTRVDVTGAGIAVGRLNPAVAAGVWGADVHVRRGRGTARHEGGGNPGGHGDLRAHRARGLRGRRERVRRLARVVFGFGAAPLGIAQVIARLLQSAARGLRRRLRLVRRLPPAPDRPRRRPAGRPTREVRAIRSAASPARATAAARRALACSMASSAASIRRVAS